MRVQLKSDVWISDRVSGVRTMEASPQLGKNQLRCHGGKCSLLREALCIWSGVLKRKECVHSNCGIWPYGG
jgi:hypothetical protein